MLDNSHIAVDGHFVNARVHNVVLAIKEYDENFEVQYIPEGRRTSGEDTLPAFRIVYNDPHSGPYVVFHIKDESEFDARVLKRIIVNDPRNRNGGTSLAEYEAWEEAQRRVAHQQYLDELEQAHEMAYHALRSKKTKYKINDNLIIDDRYGNVARRR